MQLDFKMKVKTLKTNEEGNFTFHGVLADVFDFFFFIEDSIYDSNS